MLPLPSDRCLSFETRHLKEPNIPGLCPGSRGLTLCVYGKAVKKGSAFMHCLREPNMVLGLLLSVVLSSTTGKQLHHSISGESLPPKFKIVLDMGDTSRCAICVMRFEVLILPTVTLRVNKTVRESFFKQIVPAIFFCRKLRPKLLEGNWCCSCHHEASPFSLMY